MWSCVADTKFRRNGRNFNCEGSFRALGGTLDQSWSPRSAARHDPCSAALPTLPVQQRHTNLPIVAALWCPTRGQFGVLYVVELSGHLLPFVHAAGNAMMHVFAHSEAAPRVAAVVVFMWMFSFPSLSMRDTLQQRPDPAWGGPRLFVYI